MSIAVPLQPPAQYHASLLLLSGCHSSPQCHQRWLSPWCREVTHQGRFSPPKQSCPRIGERARGDTAPWGRMVTPEAAEGGGWVQSVLVLHKNPSPNTSFIFSLGYWCFGGVLLEHQTRVSKLCCVSPQRQGNEVAETCHPTMSLPPSPRSSRSASCSL